MNALSKTFCLAAFAALATPQMAAVHYSKDAMKFVEKRYGKTIGGHERRADTCPPRKFIDGRGLFALDFGKHGTFSVRPNGKMQLTFKFGGKHDAQRACRGTGLHGTVPSLLR